ncbi:nitrite transporter NirC [Pseudoalteromonas sp. JBTF-M23]|uniref:Nitrite transporter NirC n=1 Tax=Pseudoalteromonas caenipelagi TaxID=2726988 RepID=A0A849VE13_9GAMM|nr:formate/nitrite transporter family protein [Pseudoalteromonas caenipelagi]NOU51939.1 nitrite transporter NirC [Pseudoalteromonas caenipelagi]
MYVEQINRFADQASKKVSLLLERASAICIGGLLAGAYIGFGIVLIMTLGTDVPSEFRALVMGACFAIALTLIIFAGAELFTGYTMYTTFGVLRKRISISNAVHICLVVWLANLSGSVVFALIYKLGGGVLTESQNTVLQLIAYKKINAPASTLFFNGVLCNWLVCLAIWMSARMDSDIARCISIFWCLLCFIASGYEHSVANMTIFSLALMGPTIEGISLSGAGLNLLWVTLGNTLGGVLFVGVSYWYMSTLATDNQQDNKVHVPSQKRNN